MNWLCKLFGHKISGNTYANSYYTRYFRAEAGAVDGLNTHHMRLYAECDRCETRFHVGNIHGTVDGNILPKEKTK